MIKKKILSPLLSQPAFFNSIRRLIAGNQENTKNFVNSTLQHYNVKTVLDVGCGTGDFSTDIPDTMQYLGIDINKKVY